MLSHETKADSAVRPAVSHAVKITIAFAYAYKHMLQIPYVLVALHTDLHSRMDAPLECRVLVTHAPC